VIRLHRLLPLTALVAAVALPALAAEGHSDTWLGIPRVVVLSVNLLLFLGILAYFVGPPIVRFLEGRETELKEALAEARRQREEARTMASRLEAQVGELKREMDELLERAERAGKREKEEILEQAERERRRLEKQTDEEIRYRLEQARHELTRHAVRLAAELTEERFRRELTAEDRRRFFEDNLVRLKEKA
jgi:F-type H+-transporting ATPase subunit b